MFFCSCNIKNSDQTIAERSGDTPKIVNIVNFIRQCEPRIDWITEEVLFETVEEQIKWYFNEFLEGAAMEYAYTQTGQENSFT